VPLRSLTRTLALAAWLLGAAGAGAARAQERATAADRASAFLPAQHWALRAVRRVVALGLTDQRSGWDDGTLSRLAAGEMLRAAVAAAPARRPEAEPLARGYWRRFREEFPRTAADLDGRDGGRSLGGEGAVALGVESTHDEAATGAADWVLHGGGGPVARRPSAGVSVGGRWSARPIAHTAVDVSAVRSPDYSGWRRSEAHAVASLDRASVWFGRRAPRYGPGAGGGVLLSGVVPMTGGGAVVEPFRMPWLLRRLGETRVEAALFALDSSGPVRRPWLTASHVSFSPHPRLLLGLSHTAMFGGEGQPPFTLRNFTAMYLYARTLRITHQEFENQIVSGEIRYRPPLGRLPVSLYLEWGSEDNRSAWWDAPGIIVGGELAALPGLPSVSVGVEHAYFAGPCHPCGHDNEFLGTEWYRHYIFKGGWTQESTPLGHPLGGNGREFLLYAAFDDPDARLRAQGRLLFRDRGRVNLFSPERFGREAGAGVTAAWRARPRLEVTADGTYLRGLRELSAWNQLDAQTALRFLF